MIEAHIRVERTARYFTLGGETAKREIWYACHGYRQLANRFLSRFAAVSAEHRLIVAPEGLSRFYVGMDIREHTAEDRVGATWMTREDREHEIEDYVAYLDSLKALLEVDGAPDRRLVLGFSQGVHTVCRWVVLGNAEPTRLVLWGAYPPEDLTPEGLDVLRRQTITVVRGRADPYVSKEKHVAQLARMRDMGLELDMLEHAGGHEIDSGVLEELAD